MGKYFLRFGVLFYLAMLLLVPVFMVAYRTFEHGLSPVWDNLSSANAVSALKLSLFITVIAVPINVVFGIATGWFIARKKMPLRWLVNAVINIPFAMSPVLIGVAVFALYNTSNGWIGQWLHNNGISFLFTWKAMLLATIFVSLPFVVREVVPVLEELGMDQEQAAEVLGASKLQSFFRVTLPAMRWAIVYGTILTVARALGEYGAVNVVGSNIVGQSLTLPLYVSNQINQSNPAGAYTAGLLLAVLSLIILVGMTTLTSRRRKEVTEQ